MKNNTIKKGDWFKLDEAIFKVYECFPDATTAYMYQMIYENGEYIEGEMYQFSTTFVYLYMKPYRPYQEEEPNEKEA